MGTAFCRRCTSSNLGQYFLARFACRMKLKGLNGNMSMNPHHQDYISVVLQISGLRVSAIIKSISPLPAMHEARCKDLFDVFYGVVFQ